MTSARPLPQERSGSAVVQRLSIAGFSMLVLGSMLGFFFYSFGDWIVSYTVVNNTDQSLLTWFMNRDCSQEGGSRYNGPAKEVLPTERLDYDHIRGRFEGGCIQVATVDRRVVLSQPYEEGALVVVSEPLAPIFGPIPPDAQLPGEPFTIKSVLDQSPGVLFGLALAAAGIIPLLAAAALATYRSLRSR